MKKKLLMSLMLTASIVALTACGGDTEKAPGDENASAGDEVETAAADEAMMEQFNKFAAADFDLDAELVSGECPVYNRLAAYSTPDMYNFEETYFEAKGYFTYNSPGNEEDTSGQIILTNYIVEDKDKAQPWLGERTEEDTTMIITYPSVELGEYELTGLIGNGSYVDVLPVTAPDPNLLKITYFDGSMICGTFNQQDSYGDFVKGAFGVSVYTP
ncbi:hypothetical protein HON58_05330 [Candidatus Peregrinibacteria bacterium]|jgi:hypothetical protein|nr:hypothetical protein [Candidatus Peregrinibacteria bacterium]